MANGLNATITSAVTQTVISSSAYNTNIQNLNGAVAPVFNTATLNKAQGGSAQQYLTIQPSDQLTFFWTFNVDTSGNIGLVDQTAGKYQQFIKPAGGGTQYCQTGQAIQGISRFTGTTTGTYNHNLGVTPNWCGPMQNTSGSQTMGFDSPTSSTVHVTSNAGSSFAAIATVVS